MSGVVELVAPRLLGPGLMVAAAIVVKGYGDVGDGFSAGVILALAVSLRYVALGVEGAERGLPILRHAPAGAVAGLLLALACGFFSVAMGKPPFTHVPPPGHHVVEIGTFELATAVAFDIGVMLLVTGALVALVHHLARLVGEPPA